MKRNKIQDAFEYAKERYQSISVDVERAIERANMIPVSMHCWQGDDVIGFDGSEELTGGIATTGNYPGRARNADELRKDIDKAITLIPGTLKLNLHSSYAEKGSENVDRDEYTIKHFLNWVEWANAKEIGLDFNPTFFSHKMMDGNFSLSSRDEKKRKFWIEHGKRCREIGAKFSEMTKKRCVVDFWMPDGYKDIPIDTNSPRDLMEQSLDEIFQNPVVGGEIIDSVESKLFGVGVESYTVASHEFSYGYAISRKIAYCLDAGHFHPTETISDKFTAVLRYVPNILLHITRGVRWDSDHVVLLNDELQRIMNEILYNNLENRIHIGLDYFDASINRIACWVIGMRSTRKAILKAALDPIKEMQDVELQRNYSKRLAMIEDVKVMPFSCIWDYYCLSNDIPCDWEWYQQIEEYEKTVLYSRT